MDMGDKLVRLFRNSSIIVVYMVIVVVVSLYYREWEVAIVLVPAVLYVIIQMFDISSVGMRVVEMDKTANVMLEELYMGLDRGIDMGGIDGIAVSEGVVGVLRGGVFSMYMSEMNFKHFRFFIGIKEEDMDMIKTKLSTCTVADDIDTGDPELKELVSKIYLIRMIFITDNVDGFITLYR